MRGNDVYKGITMNSSNPAGTKMTTVIELTKSETEAKSLYDQTVAQKTNEGYTPGNIAYVKAEFPYFTEIWFGNYGYGTFMTGYYNNSQTSSWLFETEAG
jgi:hypothetical protein